MHDCDHIEYRNLLSHLYCCYFILIWNPWYSMNEKILSEMCL